ncbi:MAG: hypothetical protein BWY04_01308 [candidate division CPR1 bacterium ADurb.Bin160]|uniref:Uncharacterized protein n=1 Tax=candidate division CPR1 bacterium ADurb.Bin160 TaxID=1852826 RepID=A0A1V5ZK03_9BACT|nr:MAG: hypothetical protein BWY04_01308 [candidate division CPR1 bacterium ADurb.Bin160]
MKLTYENIFLGAVISKNDEKLIVYKINQKTFYAGKIDYDVFHNRYKMSKKGTTFKDFAATNKAGPFSYEGFEITEEEVNKGKTEGVKKISKEEKKILSAKTEKLIKDIYDFKFKRGKGYRYPIYDGSTELHLVVANVEDKVLFNMNNEYILFNVKTKKYKKLESVFIGTLKEKNIPWNEV